MDFQESIELFRRMERLGLNKKGENEYINEAAKDAPDFEKGLLRKVKYSYVGRKLKLSYAGKIVYIDLPSSLVGKDKVYDFVSDLLEQLNQAIFPVKFEESSSKARKEREKEAEEESEEEAPEQK